MEFITRVEIGKASWKLSHDRSVVTLGSCFANEIGRRLRDRLFDIDINPAGTLFNPSSVASTLTRTLDSREYSHKELVCTPDGMWHLMSHHSEFSSPDPLKVVSRANSRMQHAAAMLREKDTVLMITLGSSRAFRYLATGEIAGNCHKLPGREFELVDLSLESIIEEWDILIQKLLHENPTIRIILTVSPVRHKSYGLVADRLSKSILLLACHKIKEKYSVNVDYFPAYEIFTDELRDYRFYASDMVHPSEVGADYVFERFTSAYLDENEKDLTKQCLALTRRLSHRQLGELNGSTILFEKETDRLTSSLSELSPRIANAIERIKKEK